MHVVLCQKWIVTTLSILLMYQAEWSSPTDQGGLLKALDKGRQFLMRIQREDGAICDTLNPLFETWETALAATALYATLQDSAESAFQSAMIFLRAQENGAGLICHNRRCRESYCLETTSVYFHLLACTSGQRDVQHRTDTIRLLQQPAGQWLIGNTDVIEQLDFPSVTAFVLRLLKEAECHSTDREGAVRWLLQRQLPAGHWGSAWEYYGCTAYALWPVMEVLRNEAGPAALAAKKKALDYILSQQRPDGSWDTADPGVKKVSPALQTALMLTALQAANAGTLAEKEAIDKAVAYLLSEQQENGAWDGGFFPIASQRYEKREYVFATSMAMMALNNWHIAQIPDK